MAAGGRCGARAAAHRRRRWPPVRPRRPGPWSGPRGTDRERATAYLEALFAQAGCRPSGCGEVRDCLARLHQREASLVLAPRAGTHEALAPAPGGRAPARAWCPTATAGSRRRSTAAGLRDYFDVVVDSALVGVEKPDPAIFQAALDALGVAPEEALYVGDLYEVDVVGPARRASTAMLLAAARPASPGRRRADRAARSASWPTTLASERRMT